MIRTVVVATLILIVCVGLIVVGMIWASKAKVSATHRSQLDGYHCLSS